LLVNTEITQGSYRR